MRILFKVDQAEALRRGINAKDSTVYLDFEPTQWSEPARELVARYLVDGYNCTSAPFQLVTPDRDGLQKAIAEALRTEAATPTADQLIKKYEYWGEHPNFSSDSWIEAVSAGEVRSGYWDWVTDQIEQAAHDGEPICHDCG